MGEEATTHIAERGEAYGTSPRNLLLAKAPTKQGRKGPLLTISSGLKIE